MIREWYRSTALSGSISTPCGPAFAEILTHPCIQGELCQAFGKVFGARVLVPH
jgi:hypothetical protein